MFTGIIEEIGHVNNVKKGTASAILTIQAEKVLEGTHIGDSIAVNGVCLTVTGIYDNTFTADVMHETLNRSSLGKLVSGSAVNLERAMAADGRFGGHIVSGHIVRQICHLHSWLFQGLHNFQSLIFQDYSVLRSQALHLR